MSRGYVHQQPVKRSRFKGLRRLGLSLVILVIIAGGVAAYINYHLNTHQANPPASTTQTAAATGPKTTTVSNFFQFQDSGHWAIDNNVTTASKFVYHKTQGKTVQDELTVYVNQVPIPLSLAAPRVLPVNIAGNSLQAGTISQPCVSQYAKDELHKVKQVTLSGAMMLCDPDSTAYFVIVSQVGGDYVINLKRPSGAAIHFVITYKNLDSKPQPQSLLNIVNSFQPR